MSAFLSPLKRAPRSSATNLPGWILTGLLFLGVSPVRAESEYLLSETPAEGSLELGRDSLDGLIVDEGFLGSGPLRTWLSRQFPGLDRSLREATITVSPRAYYRRKIVPNGADQEAFAAGGELAVTTGLWRDQVQLGVVGYTSQKLYGPSSRPGSGLLNEEKGSINTLGQLYLLGTWDRFSARVYRQDLDLPYVNRHDSRMIPKTFEAYVVKGKPIEGLTVGAAHISQIKDWDESGFTSMAEHAGVKGKSRGVTSAGFKWGPSDEFEWGAVNHYGWDTFNTLYTEMKWSSYEGPLGVDWSAAVQFTDERSVGDGLLGDIDAQHFGLKFAAEYRSVVLTLAATKTLDKDGIINPWGGSPSFASKMISNFDRPGELALRTVLSTDFGEHLPGLSGLLSFAHGETEDGDKFPQQDEFDVTIDYKPPWLEELWLRVRGGWRDLDGDLTEDYRVILNYEKTF